MRTKKGDRQSRFVCMPQMDLGFTSRYNAGEAAPSKQPVSQIYTKYSMSEASLTRIRAASSFVAAASPVGIVVVEIFHVAVAEGGIIEVC